MQGKQGIDIYLQVKGVKGESTDSEHKDWCEVKSLKHAVEQAQGSTTASGGVTTGRPMHDDFTVVKHIDLATAKLHEFCCSGKVHDEVLIDVMRSAGDKRIKQLSIKMNQVVISKVALSTADSLDRPEETVSFRYGKINWTYNNEKGNVAATYSVMENKVG